MDETSTEEHAVERGPTVRNLGGMAVDDWGVSEARPALVLLHGLTFTRTMWAPALAALRRIDPGRRVLALDLPGHGASLAWSSYDVRSVADAVRRAVQEAGLISPVVVGHSISGLIATVYAAQYPTSGVVNVDQTLRLERLTELVQSLAEGLRGPDFPAAWRRFEEFMGFDALPRSVQEMVRSMSDLRQDLVLGYWREVLDCPPEYAVGFAAAVLPWVRTAAVPYLQIAGEDLGPGYESWLREMVPRATVAVWPGTGHFPHLAHPERFAECLEATSRWSP